MNKKCKLCPDLVLSRKLCPFGKPTWGSGKSPCSIMFIGEAPGFAGCAKVGIAFTGNRSGKFFRECLKESGLTKEDVYTTNLVKCHPKNNRTPTQVEIANCVKYLMEEIEIVNPRYIIPLGATAAQFFVGKDKLMSILTENIYNWKGRIITPLHHPAFALRMGSRYAYMQGFRLLIKKILPIIYRKSEAFFGENK